MSLQRYRHFFKFSSSHSSVVLMSFIVLVFTANNVGNFINTNTHDHDHNNSLENQAAQRTFVPYRIMTIPSLFGLFNPCLNFGLSGKSLVPNTVQQSFFFCLPYVLHKMNTT